MLSLFIQNNLPMCLICCAINFPLVSEVTLMLLSQCPPLKSSFASWDTTNNLGVISSPGAKGPLTLRCVLQAMAYLKI